jgi:hypothetical protein
MTPGNFNWFLHTMLFYHTKHVLENQRRKKEKQDLDDESTDDEDSEDEDVD